jgi:hypothetical protein
MRDGGQHPIRNILRAVWIVPDVAETDDSAHIVAVPRR